MFWFQTCVVLLCLVLLIALCVSLLFQNFVSAPFVPSSRRKLKLAFQRLNIGPKTKLVDIGSGSGTALFAAAELGATATGVEINPFLTMYTRLRALASTHRRQISVKNQDFYKINLSEYDTVFMYLLPEVLEKLSDKIYTELTPGSRIISNTFPIPDKQPTQVIDNQFYVYIV